MPSFILQVTVALFGMMFMASASTENNEIVPGDSVLCYHKQTTCTYDGGGYWSGCGLDGSPEWILTFEAKTLCDVYHSH
jgi:hypothetical protein